jgi:hypothetical protein
MATVPELLDGHVTLYLNGYIGSLATGLVVLGWLDPER